MKLSPNQIPPERKAWYYTGMVLTVIGFLLFLSNFCIMPLSIGGMSGPEPNPGGMMFGFAARAVGGMLLIAGGQALMKLGVRGLAGSGVILDPEQARDDLAPWTKMGGGMIQDAVSEIDLAKKLEQRLDQPAEAAPPIVKIRCRSCEALNDETAKFCNQCGREL